MYDETAAYDEELQRRAARLIIGRCPTLAAQAADALRSRSGAGRQARLDRIIPVALRDPAAFKAPDRELLARAMSGPDAGPGDADAAVEAVLDVIAPKSDVLMFTDQDPAEPVRVPIIYLDYDGRPVSPNDQQLLDLARAIATAVRTASGPRSAE